jgi:hypothetical protein
VNFDSNQTRHFPLGQAALSPDGVRSRLTFDGWELVALFCFNWMIINKKAQEGSNET